MVGRLGTIMTLAGVLLAAPTASAFTMGEAVATTGVQGTLARSGTTSAAGTIGTVKKSLGASVGTKQAQLDGAGGQVAWGGKGACWATAGGGTRWTSGGQKGWTVASSSWSSASSGGSAWASGSWGGSATR